MIYGSCERLVRKLSSRRGYKIYKNETAGRTAGASRCGGELTLERKYEYIRSTYDGGDDQFVGWAVKCSKCGDEVAHYDLDDAEKLLECCYNSEDVDGGRA